MVDFQGSTIRVNFWEEQAIKFNQVLQKNKVYQSEQLKIYEPVNPLYAVWGPLELNCTENTSFQELQPTNKLINAPFWNFVDIETISSLRTGELIDVIGMVGNVQEIKEVVTKQGSSIKLKNFDLCDSTGKITVTLWRNDAEIKMKDGEIVALKKAKIGNYRGTTLSLSGFIEKKLTNSKFDEVLRWKQSQNKTVKLLLDATKSITEGNANLSHDWTKAITVDISQIQLLESAFSYSQKLPQITFFKLEANIQKINGNMFYVSKETDEEKQEIRWCLKLTLRQNGDEQQEFITAVAFGPAATKIMSDLSAKQAKAMRETQFADFMEIIHKVTDAYKQYIFHIYCKISEYQQQKQLQFVVADIQ